MSSPSTGDKPLPFEPKQKKKKTAKKPNPTDQKTREGIPEQVTQRMVRRMAIFSGVPTVLGMSSFFISYLLVKAGIKLPPYIVLTLSLGLFGLGVIGLTYGILSSSWEENRAGSIVGWSDFKLNFSRMSKALRSGNKEKDFSET
jgi:Photosynthesis affected mutant 68